MTDPIVTKTPPSVCPGCGHLLSAAGQLGSDARPAPGDYTVCLYCSALMRFTDMLTVRGLTAAEHEAVQHAPEWRDIEQTRRTIAAYKAYRRSS